MLKKIYYNEEGWVCKRYPYDIPIDDENRFIEVDEETENKTYCAPLGYSWRVVDGNLTIEIYDSEKAIQEEREKELRGIEKWFEMYDMQINQHARCVRLGIKFECSHGNIEELDAQAVINAARIKELRELLREEV